MMNVTIIGAGRTGRGMLGEQFFLEGGYHLTFADCDSALVEGLRSQGFYTVEKIDFIAGTRSVTHVDGFDVVDTVRERDAYIGALAASDYVATAVFPSSFDRVAQDLADMARLRRLLGRTSSVAVLLGGNYVGLRGYFEAAVSKQLEGDDLAEFERNVVLLTTKANRKITFPDEYLDDRYALTGDDKPLLLVDDRLPSWDGQPVPLFFQLGDAETAMAEKIWSDNLVHCSLGFMASCAGYDVVNQAVEDDRIRTLAYYAWLEGRRALEAEYGLPVPDDAATEEMFDKFASPFFKDKIARIVRQPQRKLGRNDRFIGPALLCLHHGITPYFITRAAAYGFCYVDGHEPESIELSQMIAREGISQTVASVCGLDASEEADRTVLDLIVGAVKEITCADGERFRPSTHAAERGTE